ncbi:MAG TPA: 2-phospho-L-lactate guanylyltransferase [Acidimicrobiia bacterium]
MPSVLCGIAIRSFDHAKLRLRQAMPDEVRRQTVAEMARRTAAAVEEAGMTLAVLSADEEVGGWARGNGLLLLEHGAETLNGAGAALVGAAEAGQRPWAVIHADLPLIDADDLRAAARHIEEGRAVIAPSADGGTNLIGTPGTSVEFAYGPGSFRRHLARLGALDPIVLTSSGLAFDLDLPDDLVAAGGQPEGAWLQTLVGSLPPP